MIIEIKIDVRSLVLRIGTDTKAEEDRRTSGTNVTPLIEVIDYVQRIDYLLRAA